MRSRGFVQKEKKAKFRYAGAALSTGAVGGRERGRGKTSPLSEVKHRGVISYQFTGLGGLGEEGGGERVRIPSPIKKVREELLRRSLRRVYGRGEGGEKQERSYLILELEGGKKAAINPSA